jgi:hypothetical protein
MRSRRDSARPDLHGIGGCGYLITRFFLQDIVQKKKKRRWKDFS